MKISLSVLLLFLILLASGEPESHFTGICVLTGSPAIPLRLSVISSEEDNVEKTSYFGQAHDHLEIADAICYDGTPWHKEHQ